MSALYKFKNSWLNKNIKSEEVKEILTINMGKKEVKT